jgi:GTP-binding protein LepA
MVDQTRFRNFAIVAHIDHGKSTLADRMLEITGVKKAGEGEQVLDSNPIEKERGITIKLAPVRMELIVNSPIINNQLSNNDQLPNSNDQKKGGLKIENWKLGNSNSRYILNLIDTPGHVDFSYEVSRALAACEGVILLVDATQGIQAQTLAHYYQAKKLGLKMIPVVNKIDLASAESEKVEKQLVEDLGFEKDEILRVSAKTGEGVEEVLKAVVGRIPAPGGDADEPLRALVFNSHYDAHLGVVAWVRVVDGEMVVGEQLMALGTKAKFEAEKVGHFGVSSIKYQVLSINAKSQKVASLSTGEVGWVVTGLKDAHEVQVGDTLTKSKSKIKEQRSKMIIKDQKQLDKGDGISGYQSIGESRLSSDNSAVVEPLPGYEAAKPMVWVAFYPVEAGEYGQLREALDKLKLTDSALTYEPESSVMLGRGFRVGFLGLLHAEVVRERLEREFDLSVFASSASVSYRVRVVGKEVRVIRSPRDLPDGKVVIEEPVLDLTIYTPERYLGAVMQLIQDSRGKMQEMGNIGGQVKLEYKLPLAELVGGFYDRLKSGSSGFASLDYEISGWQEGELVKLDVLLAGDVVEALAQIVPREKVDKVGRELVDKLAAVIPKQQFEVAIQAAVGSKIVARSTVRAMRKDVTAKFRWSRMCFFG